MLDSIKKNSIFALLIIFILSFFLRSINLSEFRHVELDERAWLISGVTLLKEGVPKSWTVFWDTYGSNSYEEITFGKKSDLVVSPYLDHPPLFSLLIGGWGIITNSISVTQLDWVLLRLPMVVISSITIGLTWLLVSELFEKKQAWLTAVSFAVLPVSVLSSRIIAVENILVLLLVLGLYLLVLEKKVVDKMQHIHIFTLLLVGFTAPLLKLSGLSIPLILGLLMWKRKWKLALAIWITGCLSVLVYIIYGCYFDCQLLFSILQQHSQRPQTFWYFFSMFGIPDIGYFAIKDSFALVGLIGSMSLSVSRSKQSNFILVIWLVLGMLLITIAPIELYGWYKFITFPLIAIGLGYVWQQLLSKNIGWLILVAPAFLVLSEQVYGLFDIFITWRKLLIIMVFAPILLFLLNSKWAETKFYTIFIKYLFVLSIALQFIWMYSLLHNI